MSSATETLKQQREALNAHTQDYFTSNPQAAQWWNTTTDADREDWSRKNLEAATQSPKFRAYALLRSSGFSNALDRFAEEHQLSDAEIDGVLQKFIDGTKTYQDGASAAQRFKQEFKDASLGIADVGSVGGYLYDEGKFNLQSLRQQIREQETTLGRMQQGMPLQVGPLRQTIPAMDYTDKQVQGQAGTVDKLKQEYRDNSLKYLETLATRQGEYAGLPGWRESGFLAGLTALGGQIAGAAASPENLIPSPGGPVTGGILKRMGIYGARQAGENVAVNLATEPLVQEKRIQEGMQKGFSVEGAAIRSGLGALIGGAMGGARGALPGRGASGAGRVDPLPTPPEPRTAPLPPDPLDPVVDTYLAQHGKEVNADDFRPLVSEDFARDWDGAFDNSSTTHKQASAAAKRAFSRLLEEPPAGGPVLFTGGGGGSGKSYGLENLAPALKEEADIVLDGTMAGEASARKKVKQVLDHKNPRDAQLVFTYMPTDQAWQMQVKRTVGSGRRVPPEVFLEDHREALATFIKQQMEFGENPRVDFQLIENRLGEAPVRYVGKQEVLAKSIDLLREQAQIDVLGNLKKLTEEGIDAARIDNEIAHRAGKPYIEPVEIDRRAARITEQLETETGAWSRDGGLAEQPAPAERRDPGDAQQDALELDDGAELPTPDYPVQEVPLKRITLGPENFKEDADRKTGVVAGNELKSQKYIRLGTPPIVLWERKNGKLEVITGRHRLDLARRTGEATIPSQIVREADGFDLQQARTFDAESNIRDGQGTVRDYAHYFRNSGIDEADAVQRGLTDRVKGRNGWDIGRGAGEDLYTLYRNKKISEAKAAAIGRAAPGDDAVQRAAINKQRDMTADELEVFTRNLVALREQGPGIRQDQGDLFGADDTAILEAEAIAKAAGKRIRQNTERILAVRGAAKRPEVARKMGVDIQDPDAIQKEIVRLLDENEALKRPGGELLQQLRQEANLPGKFEAWADDVIKEGQSRAFSGLDPKLMSAYAVKGSLILARGVRDFAAWSAEMVKRYGEQLKPHLDALWKEAKRLEARVQLIDAEAAAAKDGQKVRGFSKRMSQQPEEDAAKILKAPESRYTPMDLMESKERLDELSDDALRDLIVDPKLDNNLATLAGLKLRERLLERGEDTSGIVNLTAQRATTFAQNLRALREIKTSPAVVVDLVEKEVQAKGRSLTPGQRKRLLDLAREQEQARQRHAKARKQVQQRFTAEAADQYQAADRDLAAKARAMDKFASGLVPESIWDLLAKVMQGNLLTVRSLAQNILGNALMLPVRGARNTVAATLDLLYSGATGKERTLYQPLMNNPDRLAGAFEGLQQASRALLTGQSDASYIKGELQRGFAPIRAFSQAWTGKDLAVDAKTGKVRIGDRLRKLLEGVLGGPPEIMFRFLKLGDDPFRLATRRAELANQARIHGLEPGTLEWKQFMLVPPARADAAAEQVGKLATFQQDNAFSQWLQAGERKLEKLPVMGKPLKFLFKVVAPFLQFPVNYVATATDYVVPPVSLGKSIFHGVKGNRRQSLEALGASMVGATGWAAAHYLWSQGLTTPPVQWEDRKLKALQYQGNAQGIPSGSLNVSGLKRLMSGGDPKHQQGDRYIQYEGLGIPGMIFWLQTDNAFTAQKRLARGEPVPGTVESTIKAFPGLTSFMMDQTFLAGVNGMLQALQDWDRYGEHWAQNLFRAVASIPAPNTLQSLNNARWEHIPELETFGDVWNYKTLQLAKDHPVKIDLWGEPADRTPQGANPYVYNLLDPTKAQGSSDDARVRLLWKAWRQTGDTAVIPSPPTERLYHQGGEYELTPAQTMRLQQYVGRARAGLLDDFFRGPQDLPDDPEITKRQLQRIWNRGLDEGKIRFLDESPVETLKRVHENRSLEAAVDPY